MIQVSLLLINKNEENWAKCCTVDKNMQKSLTTYFISYCMLLRPCFLIQIESYPWELDRLLSLHFTRFTQIRSPRDLLVCLTYSVWFPTWHKNQCISIKLASKVENGVYSVWIPPWCKYENIWISFSPSVKLNLLSFGLRLQKFKNMR